MALPPSSEPAAPGWVLLEWLTLPSSPLIPSSAFKDPVITSGPLEEPGELYHTEDLALVTPAGSLCHVRWHIDRFLTRTSGGPLFCRPQASSHTFPWKGWWLHPGADPTRTGQLQRGQSLPPAPAPWLLLSHTPASCPHTGRKTCPGTHANPKVLISFHGYFLSFAHFWIVFTFHLEVHATWVF